MAIPKCILPPVDPAIVAADGALPHDVSGCLIKFGDDLASAESAPGTAAARDIRVPVAFRQVIGDPGDDGTEEHRQTENAFRQICRQVAVIVHVVSHVNDRACWFHDPDPEVMASNALTPGTLVRRRSPKPCTFFMRSRRRHGRRHDKS